MSAFSETYAVISTIAAADTGSGGLFDTSFGAAYLYGGFWRAGDTNNRGRAWPRVIVSLVSQRATDKIFAQSSVSSGQKVQVAMILQFDVISKADNRFTSQDAVVERLRTVFHQKNLTGYPGSVSYDMNELVFTDEGQAPTSEEANEMRWIMRARLDARAGAS